MNRKILIIDSVESNCLLLHEILEDESLSLISAKSNTEVRNLMHVSDDYDLIIIDPGAININIQNAMKMIESKYSQIPRILYTCLDSVCIPEDFGYNDYIQKPIDINRIKQVICQHLVFQSFKTQPERSIN